MSGGKNILVTGGAGYIGAHACKALAAAGYTPVAFDSLAMGHRRAVQWGPLEVGDIADRVRLDTVFERYRPEAVMHFAAFAYVGESVAEPARYYRNNVAGSLTLLEAMRDHGVGQMVFSSTCATYGLPQTPRLTEAHPQQPINPYGASKLMVERMLTDFAAAYGLRFVALRYFNAAGADPDGDIGETHDPETHLIPLAIAAARGERAALEIFGTDYPTADGTAIRDYVHVWDLAVAHVLALDYLRCGGDPTALNLGVGRGYSVREVIDAVTAAAGRAVPFREVDRRPGDPPELVAEAGQALALLGWAPRLTRLEEIVESAWRWHQRRASRR